MVQFYITRSWPPSHCRLMPFDLETLYELHYQMITLGKVRQHIFLVFSYELHGPMIILGKASRKAVQAALPDDPTGQCELRLSKSSLPPSLPLFTSLNKESTKHGLDAPVHLRDLSHSAPERGYPSIAHWGEAAGHYR